MSDQTRAAADSADSGLASQPGENASIGRRQALMATGGMVGALAASSCCILPVALFSLGVSGAWIGNLSALAPYQPYFIAIAVAFLGYGYWLVFRASRFACANDTACARPAANRLVLTGLALATVLIIAAAGFNFVAPFIFDTF